MPLKQKEWNPLVEGKNIDLIQSTLKKIFETEDVEWYDNYRFYVKVPSVLPKMIESANEVLLDSQMVLTYMGAGKYIEICITAGKNYLKIVDAVRKVMN